MQRKIHERFQQALKKVKEGKIRPPPREGQPIDWASYTEAQLNEIKDYVLLTRSLVDEAARRLSRLLHPPAREGGPPKNPADKAKAVLIQQYFQTANRPTVGLLWLLKDRLGMTEDLTYQDIARSYDDPAVLAILDMVFDLTVEPVRATEHNLSVDGTGMPTSIKQNYANERGDETKKATYDMLIGMIGAKSQLFTAYEVTGPGGESPFLVPLLEQSAMRLDRIDLVTGDAAYPSRENCTAIAAAGAVPRLFPKEGFTLLKRGSAAWVRMLTEFVEKTELWLQEYHQRSISETGNSVLKRIYPRPLLKRLDPRRDAETGFRVVSYNIRRLGYLFRQHGVPVRWLQEAG